MKKLFLTLLTGVLAAETVLTGCDQMKKIDDDCGNTAESVREPFVPELSTEDYAFGKPAADIVKLALPAIFDSGMMFQRDKPIRVFGVAPNGAEVELDWDGNIYKSFSDGVSGRFLAEIPPESAGKGHTLAVRCGEQSLTYGTAYGRQRVVRRFLHVSV